MRRLLVMLVMALTGLLVAGPAAAITNGTVDGNRHPNVGGLVNATQYSDGTWLYCSGTLISPTVFLSAAHCAADGERVRVTFDSAYQDGDKVYYERSTPTLPTPARPRTRTTSLSSSWTERSRASPRRCSRPRTPCPGSRPIRSSPLSATARTR